MCVAGVSTSEKTAPNPLTVAGIAVPGMKNEISMTLLPGLLANNFWGENVWNSVVYCGLIFPNRTGTPLAVLELTWNGCAITPSTNGPAVEVNITPRGLLKLKKSAASDPGADTLSGTPSQLISRRPDVNDCLTFGLSCPRSARNWSTAVWIAAGLFPEAALSINCADTSVTKIITIVAAN